VAIGLTASRGGLITALVGVTLIPLTFGRLGAWRSAAITFALAAALVAAWNVLPSANIDRLAAGSTEITQGGDLTGRTEIWHAGLTVFPDRPVAGYGSGTYRSAVDAVLGARVDSHDGYLAILVELGLIGFVLFLGLLFLAIVPVLTVTRGFERAFYAVLFLALLVALIPANFEGHKATWFILAIMTTRGTPVLVPDRRLSP
jgi:O-antigen ligase